MHIPEDWREYNWHTGLWDVSLEYWVHFDGCLCMEAWTVGTDDWRSL